MSWQYQCAVLFLKSIMLSTYELDTGVTVEWFLILTADLVLACNVTSLKKFLCVNKSDSKCPCPLIPSTGDFGHLWRLLFSWCFTSTETMALLYIFLSITTPTPSQKPLVFPHYYPHPLTKATGFSALLPPPPHKSHWFFRITTPTPSQKPLVFPHYYPHPLTKATSFSALLPPPPHKSH